MAPQLQEWRQSWVLDMSTCGLMSLGGYKQPRETQARVGSTLQVCLVVPHRMGSTILYNQYLVVLVIIPRVVPLPRR